MICEPLIETLICLNLICHTKMTFLLRLLISEPRDITHGVTNVVLITLVWVLYTSFSKTFIE